MATDTQQCKVQLTDNNKILAQLRKNKGVNGAKSLERDPLTQRDVYTTQYDGQIFRFVEGVPITLGKTQAQAMVLNSWIIVGEDKSSDPYMAALKIVAETTIGQPWPNEAPTICPVCRKDRKTLKAMAACVAKHANDAKDEPEPVVEESEEVEAEA